MNSDGKASAQEDLEYVGFWARFGAFLVDSLLTLVVLFPLADLVIPVKDESMSLDQVLAMMGNGGDPSALIELGQQSQQGFWVQTALAAAAALLFWIARQATPGKMLIKARIVDATTGGKPSAGQMIGRYCGYYLSIIGLLLGFFWIGWDARKQGWHDKLAGTVVVRPKKRGPDDVSFPGR